MKIEYSYGKPMTALEEFDKTGKLMRSTAVPAQGQDPGIPSKKS